tara:strand:+ start:843 stop:1067 length:225 start_codon:yes stop_codon:yes gene_type:complete
MCLGTTNKSQTQTITWPQPPAPTTAPPTAAPKPPENTNPTVKPSTAPTGTKPDAQAPKTNTGSGQSSGTSGLNY